MAENSKLYSQALLYQLCIPDLDVSKSPPEYSLIETMFLIFVKMKFYNLVDFVRLPPQVFNERAAESSKLYSLAVLYWLCIPGGSCLHSLPPPPHGSTVTPCSPVQCVQHTRA